MLKPMLNCPDRETPTFDGLAIESIARAGVKETRRAALA